MQIAAALVKELRERTGAGMMECKKALVASAGDIDAAVEAMRRAGLAKADKKAGRIAAQGLVAIEVAEGGGAAAMVEVNCETDFVTKEDDFRAFVAAVAGRALAADPANLDGLNATALEVGAELTVETRRRELVARIGENIAVRRFRRLVSDGGYVASYVHGGRIGVLVDMVGEDRAVGKDIAMHVAAARPMCVDEADVPEAERERERAIFAAQAQESGKPPKIVEKMVEGRMRKYLREVALMGQPFVKDPDLSVAKYLDQTGSRVVSFTRFEVGEGIEKRVENFAAEVMAQVRGG